MNLVPAFGWPPRFINQQAQYFAIVNGADGYLIAKSRKVDSCNRTGLGTYEINLDRELPLNPDWGVIEACLITELAGKGFIYGSMADEDTLNISTFDSAGDAADISFCVWVMLIPHSWWQPTP